MMLECEWNDQVSNGTTAVHEINVGLWTQLHQKVKTEKLGMIKVNF